MSLLQKVQTSTVSPRIACKFVPKHHRAIRNRAVRDYYLLVSDPNEFKNRAIARNFTIKSHYLRNFSEEYIFLLWKSHYCEEFTLFEYLFCFSNGTISRNSHYLRNFSEEYIFLLWKSRYCEEFTLFEYLFCFSNRAISRNSHYLNIFGPKIKSRYSEFALFESALFEDPLYWFEWKISLLMVLSANDNHASEFEELFFFSSI